MEIRIDKKVVKAKWLRFLERKDGQDFYEYGNMGYRAGVCCYNLDDDFYSVNANKWTCIKVPEEMYYITQETKARFISIYNDFMQDMQYAKNEENGFFRADFDDKYLAYKQIANGVYQIIAVNEKDDSIFQFIGSIYDFLNRFDFDEWEYTFLRLDTLQSVISRVKENTFPLFLSAQQHQDKYLEYELKYLSEIATQSEIEYLSSIDKKHRFVPATDIYDIDKIEIYEFSKLPKTFFERLDKYAFKTVIDNIPQEIIWYPSMNNVVFVRRYPREYRLKVSNAVINILKGKVG